MSDRSPGQVINTWVQTIAIVVAACWGFYTFIYVEIWVPQSAPVNITLDLELQKLASVYESVSSEGRLLVPISVDISATNPSSRTIDLLPSTWLAYGYKFENPSGEKSFFERIAEAVSDGTSVSRSITFEDEEDIVVAGGAIFLDTRLNPSETLKASYLFYVPEGEYDQIEIVAVMTSAKANSGLTADYGVDEGLTLYRVDSNGARTLLLKHADDVPNEELELRQAISRSMISLS